MPRLQVQSGSFKMEDLLCDESLSPERCAQPSGSGSCTPTSISPKQDPMQSHPPSSGANGEEIRLLRQRVVDAEQKQLRAEQGIVSTQNKESSALSVERDSFRTQLAESVSEATILAAERRDLRARLQEAESLSAGLRSSVETLRIENRQLQHRLSDQDSLWEQLSAEEQRRLQSEARALALEKEWDAIRARLVEERLHRERCEKALAALQSGTAGTNQGSGSAHLQEALLAEKAKRREIEKLHEVQLATMKERLATTSQRLAEVEAGEVHDPVAERALLQRAGLAAGVGRVVLLEHLLAERGSVEAAQERIAALEQRLRAEKSTIQLHGHSEHESLRSRMEAYRDDCLTLHRKLEQEQQRREKMEMRALALEENAQREKQTRHMDVAFEGSLDLRGRLEAEHSQHQLDESRLAAVKRDARQKIAGFKEDCVLLESKVQAIESAAQKQVEAFSDDCLALEGRLQAEESRCAQEESVVETTRIQMQNLQAENAALHKRGVQEERAMQERLGVSERLVSVLDEEQQQSMTSHALMKDCADLRLRLNSEEQLNIDAQVQAASLADQLRFEESRHLAASSLASRSQQLSLDAHAQAEQLADRLRSQESQHAEARAQASTLAERLRLHELQSVEAQASARAQATSLAESHERLAEQLRLAESHVVEAQAAARAQAKNLSEQLITQEAQSVEAQALTAKMATELQETEARAEEVVHRSVEAFVQAQNMQDAEEMHALEQQRQAQLPSLWIGGVESAHQTQSKQPVFLQQHLSAPSLGSNSPLGHPHVFAQNGFSAAPVTPESSADASFVLAQKGLPSPATGRISPAMMDIEMQKRMILGAMSKRGTATPRSANSPERNGASPATPRSANLRQATLGPRLPEPIFAWREGDTMHRRRLPEPRTSSQLHTATQLKHAIKDST